MRALLDHNILVLLLLVASCLCKVYLVRRNERLAKREYLISTLSLGITGSVLDIKIVQSGIEKFRWVAKEVCHILRLDLDLDLSTLRLWCSVITVEIMNR